jgi:S1-C subfamily serine protease
MRPQTNGMVERFNGRIEDVLQSHRFQSGEDLEQTILRYVTLYNQQLPQAALASRTPLQAMKDWHKLRPELFKKQPYYLTGCDSGFRQAGDTCVRVTMPENAQLNVYGNGWVCQSGFRQAGDTCVRVTMPENAQLNVYGNGWVCQSGFRQAGDTCVRVTMPENAQLNVYGNGWVCQSGFRQAGDTCVRVTMPENAQLNVYGNGWVCQSGFRQAGDTCVRVTMPENAQLNVYGNGWVCQSGFRQAGDTCVRVTMPENAQLNVYGNGWVCQSGFRQAGDTCVRVTMPENAQLNVYGNGWVCQSGFRQAGDTCVRVTMPEIEEPPVVSEAKPQDDEVREAASGSGFAVSSDGYVITNNHVIEGCQEVAVYDGGRAVPVTVITYDLQNDLALLKGDFTPKTVFALSGDQPELLQDVYVAGYPFGNEISSSIKVTKGIISSLTGIGNNFSNVQIDAALQVGNSGGPILDEMGNVIGVAVSKLDAKYMYDNFGSIPENTNFGIRSSVVRNILDSNGVSSLPPNRSEIARSELGKMITGGTYYVSCLMTLAQIEVLKTKKVMYDNLR